MRITLCTLLASAVFAPFASAQAATPEGLEIYPGRVSGSNAGTTFASRVAGSSSTAPLPQVEYLQMYDSVHLQGIGDITSNNNTTATNSASKCNVIAVNVGYQDQNIATADSFVITCRGENSTVARRANGAGTLYTQNVAGPSSTTTTGAVGLQMTVQMMTSTSTATAIPIPCDKTFFIGAVFGAMPANGSDGLLFWVSFAAPPSTSPTGDWPKGGNTSAYFYDLIWTDSTGSFQGRFPDRMVIAYALITDTPILQMGANHQANTGPHGADQGFGAASLLPDVDYNSTTLQGRGDGIVMRVTNPAQSNATAGVFWLFVSAFSRSTAQGIVSLGGIEGRVYLGVPFDPISPVVLTTSANADTVIELAKPKTLAALKGVLINFQGALITTTSTTSRTALSNLFSVQN